MKDQYPLRIVWLTIIHHHHPLRIVVSTTCRPGDHPAGDWLFRWSPLQPAMCLIKALKIDTRGGDIQLAVPLELSTNMTMCQCWETCGIPCYQKLWCVITFDAGQNIIFVSARMSWNDPFVLVSNTGLMREIRSLTVINRFRINQIH